MQGNILLKKAVEKISPLFSTTLKNLAASDQGGCVSSIKLQAWRPEAL